MPDPTNPTPVRVVEKDGHFAIVDANGKTLADGDSYASREAAEKDAEMINASWKAAGKERRAKGAPAVTEALVESFLTRPPRGKRIGRRTFTEFDPAKHPRSRGKFARSLVDELHKGNGVKLPSGTTVHEEGTLRKRYWVTRPNGHRVGIADPHQAVVHALHVEQEENPRQPRPRLEQTFRKDTDIDQIRKLRKQEDEDRRLRPALQEGFSAAPTAFIGKIEHGRLATRFDPALHPKDRHGKFAEKLGHVLEHGHGSRVDLPNGVSVENKMGRLRVHGPMGEIGFKTPEAAASVALAGHDEVGGGDLDRDFPSLIHEMSLGRNAALRVGAMGDASKVEKAMGRMRQARNKRLHVEIAAHHGRTEASLEKYRLRHKTPTDESVQRFASVLTGKHQHVTPHLPDPDPKADRVKPRFQPEALRLDTGYGTFEAHPVPGTTGLYELHRDGQRVSDVGVRHAAQDILSQINDEALQRHLSQRMDQRRQVIDDILKA